MGTLSYPSFPTSNGYLTETIRKQYISKAIDSKLLPENAYRLAHLISLDAANDESKPIQFWQLYSVLGQDRIVDIVHAFYKRVFDDEKWFSSVFAAVGGIGHHVNTQASMWIDVMGGGLYYHGGEYRLNFHHTHNAMALMNDKGAERWVELMVKTLNDSSLDFTADIRVRPAINTFLSHFLSKYAADFQFRDDRSFGEVNQAVKRSFNFLNMTSDAIEALSQEELGDALVARGVDISPLDSKELLVNKALSL
ncbi:MAG: hypothetical protein V3U65_03145 [Granulosicoccaceae bacterium]